jgi:hypothetical protein
MPSRENERRDVYSLMASGEELTHLIDVNGLALDMIER